jgi:hypothetical protein
MSPAAKKWKSVLHSVESDFEKAAHLQDDPVKREKLTTWSAWGNSQRDPLAPLIGRPIEALRIHELKSPKPLEALARMPGLRKVFFQDCRVDTKLLLEAAAAVRSLEVCMFWSHTARKETELPVALLRGLSRLQALELRGVVLPSDGVEALFERRGLVEVALSRKGKEQTSAVIEDQPALRRLDVNLCCTRLRLARLPVLEDLAISGGSFDTLEVDGLPGVGVLELPIGDHASLRDVGATKIVTVGLSSLELSRAPALQTLDLRDSLEGLGDERVEALRAAFPRAKILPAAKKPRARS